MSKDILIVDDEDDIRSLIRGILEDEGYTVRSASRSSQAISEIEKKITSKTKAIVICNPGNPTGYLYSKEELEQLREIVLKHDLFLFADEVYREFCYDGAVPHSVMNLDGIDNNVIMIDKYTYQQILFNLLENGLKYTKDNIEVIMIEKGSTLSIMIKDNGIGMEETTTIFTPFCRLNNAQNIKGSGLGLALVHAYVEKLHATIEVFSHGLNQGSTFTIKFTKE